MSHTHTHRCTTCQQDYPCSGELSRNFDGIPEVICSIRHDVSDPITECPSCEDAEKCDWCGMPGRLHDVNGERLHWRCVGEAERRDRRSA